MLHNAILQGRVLMLIGLAGLLMPASTWGQVIDEDDTEVTRGFATGDDADDAREKPDLAAAAELIVEQTNRFRTSEGRQSLDTNRALAETARYFADYMAENDKYGHHADGQRPAERAKAHGYQYCIVAENIATQYSSAGFTTDELASRFTEGWKESPGHRKNMLDRDVTETGVAVSHSDQSGYYYAVQMFGRPRSMTTAFEITNESGATVEYRIGEREFTLPPRYTRSHERCRPSGIDFRFGETEAAKPAAETVKPKSGDRLIVTRDNGEFHIRVESSG